jgi:hypothetical protein
VGARFSWSGHVVECLQATDKRHSRKDRIHSGDKVGSALVFYNVAPRAQAKGHLHHVRRRFLSQEDDFRVRDKFADLSSCFDSVQTWEANVQHNQIRSQFYRLLNRFQSVRDFADDL